MKWTLMTLALVSVFAFTVLFQNCAKHVSENPVQNNSPDSSQISVENLDSPAYKISSLSPTQANSEFFTRENQILNLTGAPVRIAATNWYGMETTDFAPRGLYTRPWKTIMNDIKSTGINTIRFTFSVESLQAGNIPININFTTHNPDLQNLTPIDILDNIIEYAEQIDLKIILNCHRSTAGSGTQAEGVWFTSKYPEAKWISAWQFLATRYKDSPAIIGADLFNEVNSPATWGGGGVNDWPAAAERAGKAIQAVNPKWLIIVSGVAEPDDSFWGQNLRGVKTRPVKLPYENKVVYTAHSYPPSRYPPDRAVFNDPTFPNNLAAFWTGQWGYIHRDKIAPVWVGETQNSFIHSKDIQWFDKLKQYLDGDYNTDGTRDLPSYKLGFGWAWYAWIYDGVNFAGLLASRDWSQIDQNKLNQINSMLFNYNSATIPLPIYDSNMCSIEYPPGLNFGNNTHNGIYDLLRIRTNFPKDISLPYTCRTDIPAPPLPFNPPRPEVNRPAFDAYMKSINDYIYRLSTATDTYMQATSDQNVVADCALNWLYSWAQSGVFTEASTTYSSPEGDYQRAFVTTGILLKYAIIQNDPNLNPAKKNAVETWLKAIAGRVHSYSFQREQNVGGKSHILYWMGLNGLTAGLIFNNTTWKNRGLQIFDIGLAQIGANGYLTTELDGSPQAFWRHNFAIRALVFMAEIGEPYGLDLYNRNNKKLDITVSKFTQSFVTFTTFPGYASQSSSSNPTYFLTSASDQLDWMEVYYSRFARANLKGPLQTARQTNAGKLKNSRDTSGNATVVWGVRCL